MGTGFRLRLLALLVAGPLLASCEVFDEQGCPGVVCGGLDAPVEITVRDVIGAAVTVTRQDGVAVETGCANQGTSTHCSSEVSWPDARVGVYVVHIEAAGFQAFDDELVVEARPLPPDACCGISYTEQHVTVELTPR
jgi:hypothetical protein